MPGTGKTHTIAHIVQALVQNGKTVLITAYTHSAVDNVLLKVKELQVPFLRLGSKELILPQLHQHTLSFTDFKTTRELEGIITPFFFKTSLLLDSNLSPSARVAPEKVPVIATTCSGISAALLQRRMFDYCIVDEASQITLPICVGPLKYATKFMLVGDLYQLPPLVKNVDAKSSGMAESLFKRLSEAHPDSVAALQYQYRMNSDIMLLSNELIYSNRLKCGTPEVAQVRSEAVISESS